MKWNLEELTEDAFVSYLKTKCGGLRISASWERDEMQYPACIVHVPESEPVSELAEWHDARTLKVASGQFLLLRQAPASPTATTI